MDYETRVTGGSTVATVVGSAILLVGVEFGYPVLQAAGGALVVLAIFALAAFLNGLEEEPAH